VPTKGGSGTSLRSCSSRSVNIYLAEKLGKKRKTGARIDTRIFCHVGIW